MATIFPLRPRGKEPQAGLHWADADDEALRRAWQQAPEDANKALRLDDLTVIDCDSPEAVELWERVGPPTPMQVTTGRGRHFYYQRNLALRSGTLIPGIDIKTGPRAYVVAAGSTHESGAKYEYVSEGEPAALPDSAIEALRPSSQVPTSANDVDEWAVVPEGMRNNTLLSIGGTLRRNGADEQVIRRMLLGFNRAFCEPPLPDGEVANIAHSVSRYEPEPNVEIVIADAGWRILFFNAANMELPPPPEWLWEPYLPADRLTLLTGDEGIGKGMFCAYTAVEVAKYGGGVLWLPAEDDPQDDVYRRLLAVGWDGAGEIEVLNPRYLDKVKFPKTSEAFREIVNDFRPKLVILDPGRSFIGPPEGMSQQEFSYNSDAHIRPGLESLNGLAKQCGFLCIFSHHTNKSVEGDSRTRTGGSAAFRQVVRHQVFLERVGNHGAFAVDKTNIGSRGHVCGYELESVDEYHTARFRVLDPMPEFDDIDSWRRTMRARAKSVPEFDPYEMIEAAGITPGRHLPAGRKALAALFRVGERRATEIVQDLKDEGGAVADGHHGTKYLGRPTL